MKITNTTDSIKLYDETIRYVAVFKLIQFHDLVIKNTKEAFAALSELEASLEIIKETTVKVRGEVKKIKELVYVNIHSDTITLLSKSNTNFDCLAIITCGSKLISEAIGKAILINGAVHYGQFFSNEETGVFCGKAFIAALRTASQARLCGFICDNSVAQNVDEARFYTKDKSFLYRMGASLLTEWDMLLSGQKITGEVRKKKLLVDWTRMNLDVFNQIREYQMEDFYTPFRSVYGPYNELSELTRVYFEETLSFMNHSLHQSVTLYNQTL